MCHTPFCVEFLVHRSRYFIQVFYASDSKSRQFNEHQLSHGVTAAVMATGNEMKNLSPTPYEQLAKSSHPPFVVMLCILNMKLIDSVRVRMINIFTLNILQSFAC